MKVIMLVAGYATRLLPLTLNTPKGLLKLNNKTIIEHILQKLEKIEEIDQAILVSNHVFYDKFVEFGKNYNGRIKITVLDDGSTNNSNRLGSIGDMHFAINNINFDDDVMVLASDMYFDFELLDFYNYFKQKNDDCVLASTFEDLDYLAKNFGVATLDSQNKITSLIEKPGTTTSNVAIWLAYIFKNKSAKLLNTYVQQGNPTDSPGNFPGWLYKQKPVYAYITNSDIYDIGTKKVYYELNNRLTK